MLVYWWKRNEAQCELIAALSIIRELRRSRPADVIETCRKLTEVMEALTRAYSATMDERKSSNASRKLVQDLSDFLDMTKSVIYNDNEIAESSYPKIDKINSKFERLFDSFLGEPSTKLAVYGTLAPGEVNHSVIEDISGFWTNSYVRGEQHEVGWGAVHGHPALVWKPDGEQVPAQLFTSDSLSLYWQKLDDFEGDDYCRILVPVEDDKGVIAIANIYEARPEK